MPWSSWRDRPLYVQEGDGVGARSVSGEGWALSLGQSPPGGLCVGSDGGRQRPLISARATHRPIGGLVTVCDKVDVATIRCSTATEPRVDVIAPTDGLDDRRSVIDLPAHGAPVYTADDDHAGCRRRRGGLRGSRSASSRLCAPNLSSATRVVSGSAIASGTPCGYRRTATESHGRPTSPTTVTTSTGSRSAGYWPRLLRRSQRRAAPAGCATSRWSGRSSAMAGPVGWYRRSLRLGSLPDACSAGARSLCFCDLGVRST